MKQEHLNTLHDILAARFDEEELRTLCFKLGVDYDSLPAKGKGGKVRELITRLDRRNVIPTLVETGKQSRSHFMARVDPT